MMTSSPLLPPRPMPESAATYAERVSLTNFINAYYQIRDCLAYAPATVLLVGVGAGIERSLLRDRFGLEVTTLDIDAGFQPDYVGSVHEMPMFAARQFDVAIVAHVLEHLDFRYFTPALAEIARVARHALLYLPFGGRHPQVRVTGVSARLDFRARCSLSPLQRIDGTQPVLCGGEHYWECGYRGFEVPRIRRLIEEYFQVDECYHNPEWSYSLNFRLTAR